MPISREPGLDHVELLLVDGDNLLHRVRGSRDEGGVAWLLPRLADWRPLHVRVVVALDGHPAPGEGRQKRAVRGVEFHHSGAGSADDLIVRLLEAQPYAVRSRTLVVTRDRVLRDRVRRGGGSTRSVDWLMQQLARHGRTGSGTRTGQPVGIGQGRRSPRRHVRPGTGDEREEGAWSPGRGATTKKGNPRRDAKRSRRR